MEEVLDTLNRFIRAEHGTRVTIEARWVDAGLDSFGTTMVLADMDGEYGCFPKEWFTTVQWRDELDEDGNVVKLGLTIREVIEKVMNESPKLQNNQA